MRPVSQRCGRGDNCEQKVREMRYQAVGCASADVKLGDVGARVDGDDASRLAEELERHLPRSVACEPAKACLTRTRRMPNSARRGGCCEQPPRPYINL